MSVREWVDKLLGRNPDSGQPPKEAPAADDRAMPIDFENKKVDESDTKRDSEPPAAH
jgi:hypothetical protein